MERHLDDELEKMKLDLIKLATLTEESIHNSVEALKDKDTAKAEACIVADQNIDELEIKIEEEAIEVLALFQPMAIDLRFITTAMRITTELERIADLTVNVCQRVKEDPEKTKAHLDPLKEIVALSDIAKWMVRNAIDAFVKRDESLARQVILRDSEANDLRTKIIEELIEHYLDKGGKTAAQALPLLLVARDLERVCDQAKYIAEDVIYMIRAKVVKHHPERLRNGRSEKDVV